ncbi:Uncharacterized protein PCOAH_00031360 [Plasmodium coatneyi]|uniref:Phytanoyl-CoA dioxygenase n=1 Tax=Plasmodium coatneyi TaxID=208452 RepID=A0A1B1E1A3_9APIC|nr:Uncharacterized protein PCOAH_00031360 [Plasmodium coatneyi]ANQ08813.1 Uncharacterized protein PCOAH_00031360 [Plasmodium coatneyi]
MVKRGEPLRSKFEYKYLLYALSFVSLNVGICNEYIKRKKEKYKHKEQKIYFHLTEKNFEFIDKKKYGNRIEKVCANFNLPLVAISGAANNYYPVDYHLQYLSNLFEGKKDELRKVIENGNKRNVEPNKRLDAILEDVIKFMEVQCAVADHEGEEVHSSPAVQSFLGNLNWTHLKEFILERNRVKVKSVNEFVDTLIDELYVYAYIYLLVNYKRNNFFDFVRKKRSYRHCSENVGKDLGLELSSYLGLDQDGAETAVSGTDAGVQGEPIVEPAKYVLNIDTVNEIQESLATYGVVVLKNFLRKVDMEKIKKDLFLDKKEMNVSPLLMDKDNNIFCIRPTRGRQYCILRNSKVSDLFTNLQQYWMNIIYAYLPIGEYQNMYDLMEKNSLLKMDNFKSVNVSTERNDKIFLSELQLVNNEPLSEIQSHHVDNGLSGISVILPLNRINEESGNFEFFLGTHLFTSIKMKKWKEKIHNFKRFLQIYYQTGSSFVPDVNPQDVIIYDSKILHRGLSNNLWVKNSSLIYRYDYKKYPPPGQDFIDICSYNFIGKCISVFNFFGKYL